MCIDFRICIQDLNIRNIKRSQPYVMYQNSGLVISSNVLAPKDVSTSYSFAAYLSFCSIKSSKIMCAPFSAMAYTVACKWALICIGITLASITRKLDTPYTRSRESTTPPSTPRAPPIPQVPMGCLIGPTLVSFPRILKGRVGLFSSLCYRHSSHSPVTNSLSHQPFP